MSSQYDDMMGSEQPQETHPDNSQNYKMAGAVLPIRTGAMDQDLTTNPKNNAGAVGQLLNEMNAASGYKNTSMTNIKILRPTSK